MRRLIVLLSLVSACAPSSSGPVGGSPVDRTFAAECEVQCRTESEDSGCDAPTCVEDCIAMSGGLETLCGKCVVSQTSIYDDDGTCRLSQGSVMGVDCEDVCSPGSHQPRPDFRAECESQCQRTAEDAGCTMPTCVDDCVAMTTGLETQCGKCHVSMTEIRDDDGTCTLSVGAFSEYNCDDSCEPGTHRARADFRQECEVTCRGEAHESGCAQPPTCVDDCVAMTAGLETQCGKCVAAQTEIYNGDGCELSVGTVDDGACDADCTR